MRGPAATVDHRQRPGSLSAATATQKQQFVHRVLHLPRKKTRGPAATADHRQRPGSLSAATATQKQQFVHRVLHLPRKKTRGPAATVHHRQRPGLSKCCTCHAKRCAGPAATVDHRQRPGSLSAAPATQKQHPVHRVLHLPRKKVRGPAATVDHRQHPGSLSAAPATQKQHPVHQVLHLPRKKVCGPAATVDHRQRPGSLRAAPATQKDARSRGDRLTTGSAQAVYVLRLPTQKGCAVPAATVDHRQRPGSLSAAPATQKQHPAHRVLHLPRKKGARSRGDRWPQAASRLSKCLHLPRKSSSLCTECCTCHAKRGAVPRRPLTTGSAQAL